VESVEDTQVESKSVLELTPSVKIPVVHELVCESQNPPDDSDDDLALYGAASYNP